MDPKIFFVGSILLLLCKHAQTQMSGMMGMMNSIPRMVSGMRASQAREQITPIVKFIVGHTATPSPEMVNFAVIAGSAPVTQAEKDAYLDMMKKIARQTPEALVNFIKLKNGTYVLDEMGLDAHITMRAMQYAAASSAKKKRKATEKETQRKQEIDMIRMMQDHEIKLLETLGKSVNIPQNGVDMVTQPSLGFGMDPGVGYDVFGAGTTSTPLLDFGVFDHHYPQVVDPQPQVATNTQSQAPPASNTVHSGSFSLLDLFRNAQQNNAQQKNKANDGNKAADKQVTPQVPSPVAPQVAQMPAGDPGMMNLMMMNMGMGF